MYSFSIKPGWVQLAATVGFFFFIKFFLSFQTSSIMDKQ